MEGQSPSNIHERMTAVYGDSAPSRTMVFEWARRFKNRQLNIEDSPSSGRTISATDERTIRAVENLVIEDRRITIQAIAEILSISSGTAHSILHDHLHMTKVCSTWVPYLLTPVQRHERVEACEGLLARYEKEGNDFLFRITTGDESWFYYYQSESKQISKQWKRADSLSPTKLKQDSSEPNVLYSFFWDYNGVILKEPVPAGTTISKTYYANLLIDKLHPEIKERRRGLISAGVTLHHDNASAHTSYYVLSTIHNLRYELLRHPSYSPDLAPSDYCLFPLLKNYLKERRYEDRSALDSSIYQYLNGASKDVFTAAIQQLPERWRKYISVDGRNFEKEHIYV